MLDTNDRASIGEQYICAGDSSNLKVEAEKSGDADVLIAAGWSASRIGMALLRLHTKVDCNTLEAVQTQVAMQADKWGVERPDAVASSTLGWWIARICHACQGRKFEKIADTPALSTKPCKCCRGSGEAHLAHGEAGKRVARWLDECTERAQASIKKRLHNV